MPDERRPFRQRRESRPQGTTHGGSPPRRPGGQTPGPDRPYARAPYPGGGRGPGAPFTPRPAPSPTSTVRLRDGDREVELSGDAAFVREMLEELPALMSRLGEPVPGRRSPSIAMPPPPAHRQPPADAPTLPAANGRRLRAGASLEDRVLHVLRAADHPLSIAVIRQRLGGSVSGQQVRRILERAPRVDATDQRPAAYSIR